MALIRVYSRDNGAGLSRDLQLVRTTLADAGHALEVVAFGGEKGINALHEFGLRTARAWRGRADVQIFVERVYPRLLALGRRNLLIPNPEWFPSGWRDELPRFDTVLCKTRHAQAIFNALGCATAYVGFTSEDRLDATVARERAFFHLAGRSSAKGTDVLLETWRLHPEWPRLTVVQGARKAVAGAAAANVDHRIGYFDDAQLKEWQNRHLFHACPSEMEGFGHSLMEAMSTGAVALATDGAPMNELVAPDRGVLVAPSRVSEKDLSPRYFVDAAGIEAGVENLLALDDAAIASMRACARLHFEQSGADFRTRLVAAVGGTS